MKSSNAVSKNIYSHDKLHKLLWRLALQVHQMFVVILKIWEIIWNDIDSEKRKNMNVQLGSYTLILQNLIFQFSKAISSCQVKIQFINVPDREVRLKCCMKYLYLACSQKKKVAKELQWLVAHWVLKSLQLLSKRIKQWQWAVFKSKKIK